MEQIGTLETLCRYPVKSMRGEEVDEAFVGYSGVMGDRVFAFLRTDRPKGFPWHTAREQEDLLLFRPRFRQPEAATLPVDVEASFGMAPGVNPLFPPAAPLRWMSKRPTDGSFRSTRPSWPPSWNAGTDMP